MSAAVASPSGAGMKPKSMTRPKHWSEEVEENYRFQLAGYRDRHEYAMRNGEQGVSSLNIVRPGLDACVEAL